MQRNLTHDSFLLDMEEGNSSVDFWNTTTDNETVENIFDYYPQSLIYFGVTCSIVFTVIGVPGNLLTILALLKTPKLRNATSTFIINLCLADALYCGFSLPLAAATFLERRWPYGETLCAVSAMIRYSNGTLSLLIVMGITVNRYVLIVHPMRYGRLCNRFTIGVLIAMLWGVSILVFVPTAAGVWGTFGFDPKVGTCTIVKVNGKSSKTFVYVMAFVLPCSVFVFCYSRIYLIVRRSERKLKCGRGLSVLEKEPPLSLKCCGNWKRRKEEPCRSESKSNLSKDLKLLRIVFVIFVSYIICYFPLSIVKLLKKETSLPMLNVFGYLGTSFSCCVNLIIYVVMSKEYRKAYWNLYFCRKLKKEVSSVSNQKASVTKSSDIVRSEDTEN